mgnify:CR=1 FL=1
MCVWVYSLFTDVPGDYIKKPMKECTGEEITAEWLYHLGIPVNEIDELAKNHCNTTPTMMPYITAFFMPRRKGDRPDVIPDGCVNLHSLDSLLKHQEILFSPLSTPCVLLWKLYTDFAA